MIRKLTLFFLLICSSISLKAQNWGGGIDDQDYNWGFLFQYIVPELKITKTPNWRAPFHETEGGLDRYATDSLNSISSPGGVGFGIGLVINKRVTNHIDLRFTPVIVFADRQVDYQYQTPAVNNKEFSEKLQKVSPTMVEFPLGLKIKSDRRRNFRAYMLGGAKFNYDLASGKIKEETGGAIQKVLRNSKSYFSYEAGIGFDLYFEYFKMSPEIKVSHSFNDVLRHDDTNPYAFPIEKAILRSFTFSLFFE